jgi:hypothetical protein
MTAPWNDYSGAPIKDGDLIRHPSGEIGRVILGNSENASESWRVDYGNGFPSLLCLQIGDKGRAVVI